jgi:hypothetical protein
LYSFLSFDDIQSPRRKCLLTIFNH